VADRTQESIFPIISSVVCPGTTIWTDEYSTYTGGPRRNQNSSTPLSFLGPYNHQYVNHSLHFSDPENGVNTNAIEGSWILCKRKFKIMFGTRESFIPSYLDEFMWRRRYCRGRLAFDVLIENLREMFDIEVNQ
jgi:hypothetical protein